MVMIEISVDGEAVEVEAGTSVLMALLAAGHAVPHPCFHPSLSAPASCRMCMAVEDGPDGPQLITTCNRIVQQGQKLSLQDARVVDARRGLVDDLLLRHPPECSVCERAGECEVQETVHVHGDGTTRATSPIQAPRVELGPRLELDRSRCILCTRCVRFEAEVTGTEGLVVNGAGIGSVIATCGAGPVTHEMSGNLVDLCPAGALLEPEERLRPPAWQMTGVSSTCPGCASGCAVRVDVANGIVQRVRPSGDGTDAQGYWLCDTGRFGWQEAGDQRLQAPVLFGQQVEWDAAFAEVAEQMEQANHAAVLLSPYLSNEETFLLSHLALRWDAELFLWSALDPAGRRTFPSGFTIHEQRAPNAAGVAAVAATLDQPLSDAAELTRRLAAGTIDAVYAVGGSLHDDVPELPAAEGLFLVAHDVQQTHWQQRAQVVLAGSSAWTEKDGTFIDADGRLQRVRAAVSPPASARPDFWILAALWHGGPNRDSPDAAFSRLARSAAHGPFCQLDYGILERRHRPAEGIAFGGGWTSHLQRRGLIRVEDHARRK